LFSFQTIEYILLTSKISSKFSGGRIEFIDFANIVFQLPGDHIINKLCNHPAAIDKALFAIICHFMSSKSFSKNNSSLFNFIFSPPIVFVISFHFMKNSTNS
jgi:hypothetical protein